MLSGKVTCHKQMNRELYLVHLLSFMLLRLEVPQSTFGHKMWVKNLQGMYSLICLWMILNDQMTRSSLPRFPKPNISQQTTLLLNVVRQVASKENEPESSEIRLLRCKKELLFGDTLQVSAIYMPLVMVKHHTSPHFGFPIPSHFSLARKHFKLQPMGMAIKSALSLTIFKKTSVQISVVNVEYHLSSLHTKPNLIQIWETLLYSVCG